MFVAVLEHARKPEVSDILKKRRKVAMQMKEIIPLIAILVLLAACAPQAPLKEENVTATTITANLTITDVLSEFDAFDAQYNTSWKKEQISKAMIRPEALQPWTDHLLALRNVTQKDTLANELIEARLEMLSSQTAVYLGVDVGPKGAVPYTKEANDTIIVGKLDCSNIEHIAKATKLYQLAYHSWVRFASHMDRVLQDSMEAREKLGINKNKMPFYTSSFQDARQKVKASAQAAEEQCGFRMALVPEPDIPTDLQHAGSAS